jgi:adenosylcobinamide-GDP ribazoletransferase
MFTKDSIHALRGTLAFLTVLPAARGRGWQGAAMLPWFPVAGLMMGGAWAAFDRLVAGALFADPLRAGLDVLFLVVLTGGLHLDGLADSADGLLSHRGPERALEIMKDSRTGTWGVAALILVLGLKTLALWQVLAIHGSFALVLIPAYGRTAMLAGFEALPYGRRQEGIAYEIFQSRDWRRYLPGVGFLVLVSLGLGAGGWLAVNFGCIAATGLMLWWYRRSLGCITGDMLGALGEVTEVVLLIVLAAL